MTFKFIEDIIPGIRLNLNVLKRGTQRYSMLLYQHEGDLQASTTRIGNARTEPAKFESFINLALAKNVDLAVTPEYSCPWECIRRIVTSNERWPKQDKLWAFAAESINKEEIQQFEADFASNDIGIYFDHARLTENKNFFDPIVYLFRSHINGQPKLTVIIQFKTYHMGVWSGGAIERNNLIEGNEIYILRNAADSVHLISLICSEAMNFPTALTPQIAQDIRWFDTPFLIIHPQINPDPQHHDFIEFRNYVFGSDKKEIVSLNWNKKSTIGGKTLLRYGTSRSGLFIKSPDVSFKDSIRIKKNHLLGLYYFYFKLDRHAYFFNSEPHVFLLETLSVSITGGNAPQRMRDGPELIETFNFDNHNELIAIANVSDQHLAYLNSLACTNAFLLNPENCVLEKERLVCLSSGEFIEKSPLTWSDISNLYAFRIAENAEVNRRITFAEDQQVDSENQRATYVRAVGKLNNVILPDKSLYPASIADLRSTDVLLAYSQSRDSHHHKIIQNENFRYNLVDNNGEMVFATVCYLDIATPKKIDQTFDILQAMFDTGNMNRGRVVVFYTLGQEILSKSDASAGSIVTSNEFTGPSYLS